MRRYQYRLNDQNVSLSPEWARLTPLKYIETIPGETYGGGITVKANTGLMDKVIHSRAYYDIYAFYCPIRLLWSEFPKFLASSEGEIQPPQVTSLMPENFESSFAGTGLGGGGSNAAFLRRMYYMVHANFFLKSHGDEKKLASERSEKIRQGEYDAKKYVETCEARPSTFDLSWLNESEVEQQTILSVASGQEPNRYMATKLDDIRRAYALDRWEKMRDYYGGHYTDLLKGYGVKADWGMLQEPECIGISNNDFRFVQRNSTGDSSFGERNGYFEGEYKLKIKKTFTPEHGIIGFFAVARADVFNEIQGAHILATRDDKSPSNWWDPITWKAYNQQTVPGSIINTGREGTVLTPMGEHLRKGRNEVAVPSTTDWDTLPVFSKAVSEEKSQIFSKEMCKPEPKAPATATGVETADERVNVSAGQICHYTECRVSKRSPLVPSGVQMQA